MNNHQAAIEVLTRARKAVATYIARSPAADMKVVCDMVKAVECAPVFMGATLCVYAPNTAGRFCIDLETLEIRDIIKH